MRWNLTPDPDPGKVSHLSDALNIDPLIAKLLVQRGIETFEQARKFFRPTLNDLHDPFLMKDMDKAVTRIEKAIADDECILIFGDYDVDGTTAVSLVYSYLREFHPNVATYIPDRYDEGYGISYKGIDYAEDNGCGLIIALDCGIKSIAHVEYARSKNIDFIICDHHRPGSEIPNAIAVLDPKREDCSYPYDELCGCGIGFKLIQAIGQNRGETIEDVKSYLDLVATAIAADIVPMTGENRVLAKFGLEAINSNPRPGIAALTVQIKKHQLDISDVVFIIAPRINAAGRIRHGNHAVALLSETDIGAAAEFAKEIEQYNADRKEFDRRITAEALVQIDENSEHDRFTTVVFDEGWHKGVIGIVASRLIETYYRPTLVFTKSGEKYAASARSVIGFDVYNALESCAEHIEQFGGHMYAAGLTLPPEKYNDFKLAFEETVKSTIPDELRIPEIAIDAEIGFNSINLKMLRLLKQFEPFGPQNRTPVFLTRNLYDTGFVQTLGKDCEHLRMFVKQNGNDGIPAVGFGLAKKIDVVLDRQPFEAAYCIDESEYNNVISLQLRIKDIRPME